MKKIKTDGSIKSIFRYVPGKKISRPVVGATIPAGFPSPAQDYIDGTLDLSEYLIQHPAATFFMYADGYSMIDAGIHPGDLLIVDRAIEPANNKIVVAIVDMEFTLKRLKIEGKRYWLIPENDEFEPIEITEDMDFRIWGVVTYVIHPL
ncbi:MAG TPA: translesion error-prone DNA polymerase V autoproteolytic subunit [Candidatus Cloacimonetes bacterium]|nr:translesion error-prone DNA polymerase V autoproteolytic subunit [Candidatus Cloacimonadota bacterium]